jgi:hypothetical protein
VQIVQDISVLIHMLFEKEKKARTCGTMR